jgi:hypothetical protein
MPKLSKARERERERERERGKVYKFLRGRVLDELAAMPSAPAASDLDPCRG